MRVFSAVEWACCCLFASKPSLSSALLSLRHCSSRFIFNSCGPPVHLISFRRRDFCSAERREDEEEEDSAMVREYVAQLATMVEYFKTTLYVDFTSMLAHSQALATAVLEDFYR